jgi:ADP-heptose:LPS heptosyltransferase
VFFFGPDEAEDAAKAPRGGSGRAVPGRTAPTASPNVKGPLLVIALAGRLSAAVANDAGPGHMLAAGGAPLLSLQQDPARPSSSVPPRQA